MDQKEELQKEIKKTLEKYRLENIDPFMEEDDEKGHFRKEIYAGLGELGFGGVPVSSQWGGAELGHEDFSVVLEEIAKSSIPYAVTLSVSTMVQKILEGFATHDQKEKYLPALTSGREIGAFALSESASGTDAASLKTTAKKVEGGYKLNGNKMWITSGGIASVYIVMARTGGEGSTGISAFIVEDGTEGFTYGKLEKKMGWKTSPTRELVFENCFIPEQNLLAKEGEGFDVAKSGLNAGRITIGAIAVGASQRALDESVKYSLQREQFKTPIFNFQGLQFMMADMATETECSRQLVREASRKLDRAEKAGEISAMAKMKATDVCMKVTTDAVQIHGGVGYTTEYPVERLMRDAKVLQIVEGTNQIQRVLIAKNLRHKF